MIIGIDTSCYTTSVAGVARDGQILLDRRFLLDVSAGEKGLRQSDAVFQHLQNFPRLLAEPLPEKPEGIMVSIRPRPVEGSYLPVFKVGASFGETLAGWFNIPFWTTSHQEGHIRAGLCRYPELLKKPFLAWHISGGTTELLYIKPGLPGFEIQKIGGTSDLHAGQFVDRIGVALGTGFPAGPALERMAEETDQDVLKLPVSVKGYTLSLSGPTSAAERLIRQGTPGPSLARAVFDCIGRSLVKITLGAVSEYHTNSVLLVGGVASNHLIRRDLEKAGMKAQVSFLFGAEELSPDNAVGVALLGNDRYLVDGI